MKSQFKYKYFDEIWVKYLTKLGSEEIGRNFDHDRDIHRFSIGLFIYFIYLFITQNTVLQCIKQHRCNNMVVSRISQGDQVLLNED